MGDLSEGIATDDSRIQIDWEELTEQSTGGSAILSYNLDMLIGGVWTELVGQTTYYSDTSYLIQTGIVSGQSYSFRVRARNKWGYGPYSNTALIEASTKPDTQISTPTLINSGLNIVVSWPLPEEKGSSILEYQIILIVRTSLGTTVEIDSKDMNCDGLTADLIDTRMCTIPVSDFRTNFDYPDLVYAKIRSRNINGWSDFSSESTSSALIITEPVTMGAIRRGEFTDHYHIHIVWDALVDDQMRGSQITSYYVQWDKGTNAQEWYDLIGLTDAYLQLDYTLQFGDIASGVDYKFKVKAQNLFGFSTEWSTITTITANSNPDPVDIVTTSLVNSNEVRIDWAEPSSNFSPLELYEIMVADIDGQFSVYKDCGSDPAQSYCDIPIMVLRQIPYSLVQGSLISAKVRAKNAIGWGSYSQANLLGLNVFVEPYAMQPVTRGDSTSET